jgi:hypothetical protein
MDTQASTGKPAKVCPHCRQEVDPKASRCPHCQGKIYQWTGTRKFIAGSVAFLAIMAFIGTITGGGEKSPPTTQAVTQSLSPGQMAYLRLPDNTDPAQAICLAPNIAVYTEYTNALLKKNYEAIVGLADKGLFCVHNGSQVSVTESNSVYTKVRVVKGVADVDKDKVGESGWSVTEWVSAQ